MDALGELDLMKRQKLSKPSKDKTYRNFQPPLSPLATGRFTVGRRSQSSSHLAQSHIHRHHNLHEHFDELRGHIWE